ncbi:MAG TPA: hypothetical protein VMR34_01840 [Candidatus Saccharimonadales bacterium]|nr:hypothetical protein [Candidatus Saccharimonadales bacterium]
MNIDPLCAFCGTQIPVKQFKKHQKEDLIAAGVKHAVNKHGHEDNEELRKGVEGMLEIIEVN